MVFNSELLNNKVTLKRMCFSSAFMTFNPEVSLCAMNAPANKPVLLSEFSREWICEIEEYLRSYSQKPYVTEAEGCVYIVIPSKLSFLHPVVKMPIKAIKHIIFFFIFQSFLELDHIPFHPKGYILIFF